jgi:hypothetical protein
MFFRIYDNLYLGDHNSPNELKPQAVLSVMNDVMPFPVNTPYYLKVPIPDGLGIDFKMINISFRFLDFCSDNGLDTLVQCWSGRSRSVSIASGWIHKISERPLADIVKEILIDRIRFESHPDWKLPVEQYPFPHPVVLGMVRSYLECGND